MPFISEATSAIKSRFGFRSSSSEPSLSIQSTPELFKSASKENLLNSSAIRSFHERCDESLGGAPTQSFELNEDPAFWKDRNVQVIIRIRPLSGSEISTQGYNKCVKQDSCQTITWTGHPESRFTFDAVADENVSQEKLFNVAGLPMVDNCMGGYNSCMFAYGQTGSGKTHTMLGDIEGGTRRHSVNCGMTPRVFEYLFSRIQKEKEARRDEKLRFTCKCSFLEIYNEQILDLLDPSSTNLQIREDTKKGVYVENLKELEASSARDVMQQLIQGAANRKVAATNMNRASSRSHSVFTCTIESKWEVQGVTHYRFARLNLVDLAGSERQKSSGAEGDRLKEATNINKSLSSLGLVIMNLVNISNGKSLHVPYRDSKLTFLLQDSLGGNSKTIIIANISPSNCCSLETLSTLKFAQRAKFIKNNAVVNEDASGDVLAMRMQIQQLKKEVSVLRGLVNGEEDHENSTVSFPGSPGKCFKWEGLQGSFSPITIDKRISYKKDYDVALVGAIRRERDKDIALQALAAENQAAKQLTKQREDEIQGLKMRLRLREAGMKRLEAVASGKISAEAHLLKEKEEQLKEIEVMRAQVDRNQEVTRFAMENLRLKEEIRRLKSFYEEGEREALTEQFTILQDKLLEALDWKLMHESEPSPAQKGKPEDIQDDSNLLISGQQQPSPSHSAFTEENEFLRVQAIQNQAEMNTLRRKLDDCLLEKENLEKQVDELACKLERESKEKEEKLKDLEDESTCQTNGVPSIVSDQMELKTMVDAIATASQREAKAHEIAINLSEENDKYRMKLKVLIEDNNKLIEVYEQGVAEIKELKRISGEELNKVVNLEHQLMEMHEENDKLMGLYEKAMQERDEYKRMIASSRDSNCPEKLVEVDDRGACFSFDNSHMYTEAKDATGFPTLMEQEESRVNFQVAEVLRSEEPPSCVETSSTKAAKLLLEDIDLVKIKLDGAEEKLLNCVEVTTVFGSLEKIVIEAEKLLHEIKVMEDGIWVKQQEFESLKLLSFEMHERSSIIWRKLMALKYSLSTSSPSVLYFEKREAGAKQKLNAALSYLDQTKEELDRLYAYKNEVQEAQKMAQQSQVQVRDGIACMKSKLDEENKRHGKVLFAIDNVDKKDVVSSQKKWHLGGKATDLLKAEEEKIKLQNDISRSHERLGVIQGQIQDANKKYEKVESRIQVVETDVEKGLKSVEKTELGLQRAIREKEMFLEYRESGLADIESMIIELVQYTFEAELKDAEMKMLEDEMLMESTKTRELRIKMTRVDEKRTRLLEDQRCHSHSLSEKMGEELQMLHIAVLEAKSLLQNHYITI